MKKPNLYIGLLIVCLGLLMGCEDVETDPGRILPVLRQAYHCCEGRCNGLYLGLAQGVACADVRQMESCLRGDRDQCPLKGQGGF